MISRIHFIQQVGCFENYTSSDGTDLRRLSLIYAENARGKTTLTAILRSLESNEPGWVQERKRFGATGEPHVVLRLNAGATNAVFQNRLWSVHEPNVIVFDDTFVDQNIYSGLEVSPEHRKGLREVIIGREGVRLARDYAQFTTDIAEVQKSIKDFSDRLSSETRRNIPVDVFCSLPQIDAIETEIEVSRQQVSAREQAELVTNTGLFATHGIEEFDFDSLNAHLLVSLEDIDRDAIRTLNDHFAQLGERGESWVEHGMQILAKRGDAHNDCPFCAQTLANSDIFVLYRSYFSDEYKGLVSKIREMREILGEIMSSRRLTDVRNAIESNRNKAVFWRQFITIGPDTIDLAQYAVEWDECREIIQKVLSQKLAAPLEPIVLPDGDLEKIRHFVVRTNDIRQVNESLLAANALIENVKQGLQIGELSTIQRRLDTLLATVSRYSLEVDPVCRGFLDASQRKRELEQQKEQVKHQLDAHQAGILPTFQASVNEYLQRFGASFRIARLQAINPSGRPSSSYCIEVNNTQVVAGPSPRGSEPTFGTVLSSGDRNLLAVCFFFAQLDTDIGIADRIVVLDDPITSLDDSRLFAVALRIRQLSNAVAQTIVLSHSKRLLCTIWDDCDRTNCATLKVHRNEIGSEIVPWNVNDDSYGLYDQRHALMRQFLSGQPVNIREVAVSMRQLLEGYLRVVCVEHFPPEQMLGPFLNIARTNARVGLESADIQRLDELKEYVNRFHHDSHPAWETAIRDLNDGELRMWVERLLQFTKKGAVTADIRARAN